METEGYALFVYVDQRLCETSIWKAHDPQLQNTISGGSTSTGQPGVPRNSKNYRHSAISTKPKEIQSGGRLVNGEPRKDKTDEMLGIEEVNYIVENSVRESKR